ncbi:ATP-binding protein [Jiella sp. M17.18]|uniref:ATP-binding protein n=1 Tax=Jiella sp. M17.18 TaxID=3234247 RepID=UPI0034E03396
MTKMLSDVVDVRRRFQRSIRIDADIHAGAIEGFVCPRSTADAVRGMARQIAETGQGAFTWTGPYGCGKSSLAVALAGLLSGGDVATGARRAIGDDRSDEILNLLGSKSKPWAVLPVVGRRADPATAVRDAMASAFPKSKAKSGKFDPAEELLRVSKSSAHAGVFVFIDEMGKFLEEAASGKDVDVYFFQQLAEAANRSKGRLVVVGILHQSFDDYAHRLNREARDEWLKIQGRFSDIPINVAGEEQIELVARAIETAAAPAANRPLAETIAAAVASNRPGTGADLGARLHECWPLHPIVACLLGPLSRRRFGQNQRSVFGFLNSAEPFAFQQFLEATSKKSGSTYGAPLLWEYLRANLEPSILASPDGHRWSLAVDAVERCDAKGATDIHLDLVKSIALIDLFKDRSGLAPSEAVLRTVLSSVDPAKLERALEDLKAWSTIIYRRHTNSFSIYAGSDFDIDAAVDEAIARIPAVDLSRLRTLAPLQPVLAKRHHHETGTLRWFEVDIASLADGADRVKSFRPKQGATGLFLLLMNSDGDNDEQARRLWRGAAKAASDYPVAVGRIRENFLLREQARELIALETVRTERSELQGDAVARREISARIARLTGELETRLIEVFGMAEWTWKDEARRKATANSAKGAGLVLSRIASDLCDERYDQAPVIRNELLNRIKPSSNAMGARKELLRAMVDNRQNKRLGFVGYPAAAGLYDSLLSENLHVRRSGKSAAWEFVNPADSDNHPYGPMWRRAEKIFMDAGPSGADLGVLYDAWKRNPFGVRDGLLPVFAVAYLLSRAERLAIYLDGVFQTRITPLLIDRLTQDPTSVRLRWVETSPFHAKVLSGVADLVDEFGDACRPLESKETIDIAKRLVGIVLGQPAWVLRTNRLSGGAARVRNLAKLASDPNKFLLDDLPTVFADGADLGEKDADRIVSSIREGLTEIVGIYPDMLENLEGILLRELRVKGRSRSAMNALHERAVVVKGLTGNFRLDALATRLAAYTGAVDEIEGIASLAANKPPKDWVDRDVDNAGIELAALAQEFVRAEAFAHVKNREDGRIRMAFFIGDPDRPTPVMPDFDIGTGDRAKVGEIVNRLKETFNDAGVATNVALAALAEFASSLAEGGDIGSVDFDHVPEKAKDVTRLNGGADR